jgi:plasmid maintenance system antidote protein VapI
MVSQIEEQPEEFEVYPGMLLRLGRLLGSSSPFWVQLPGRISASLVLLDDACIAASFVTTRGRTYTSHPRVNGILK